VGMRLARAGSQRPEISDGEAFPMSHTCFQVTSGSRWRRLTSLFAKGVGSPPANGVTEPTSNARNPAWHDAAYQPILLKFSQPRSDWGQGK
jgi:hypothetical protein